MKNKIDIEKCTGCNACYNICPVGAIEMRESEGFLYPFVDKDKCTNCGMCERVCLTKAEKHFSEKEHSFAYVIQANDEIRSKSSSGGAFTLLANKTIEKGGFVCGACYKQNFAKVEHIIISKKEDLPKLQTSKYVQSDIGQVYKEIKSLLQNDKLVLFTGTSCQVEGLNNYLGKKYEKLITVDILCHGVPSPVVWEKYLNEISGGKQVVGVNFRDKISGWKSPLTLSILFEDGTTQYNSSKKDTYFKAFLKNLILRKSCSNCQFTSLKRVSDITIGDFWKIHKFNRKFDDNKGCSMILANTVKGDEFFEQIKNELKLVEKVPVKYALRGNPTLKHSHKFHQNHDTFFDKLYSKNVIQNIEDSFKDKYDGVIANLWDCNYNYGAILTAYALQQFFKDKKLDYRILNCNPKKNTKKYKNSFVKKFADKNLKLTEYIKNPKDLKKLNYCADNFVVGSDQVFRDHCMKKYFDAFLLPYTDFTKRRVAFSASFGKDSFDAEDNDIYILSKYLKRFDSVSVREVDGVKLCKNTFGIEAEHILDPVFLVAREKFLKFVDKEDEKYKNKIVYMLLDKSKKIQTSLNNLSQELNLETVGITGKNLSVEEFLTAIYNCEYFVTDSFHGTCFALLFHKKFISLKNKYRGNSRFDSLIETFGINKCFNTELRVENFHSVAWDEIEEIIKNEIEKTNVWFDKAFYTPRSNSMIENELDVIKYSKEKLFKNKFSLFSIKKNSGRTIIQILGIKLNIKRK